MKQIHLFKKQESVYGGEYLKTRAGRSRGHPLSTKDTMHLVLRSSQAVGEWSFRKHKKKIEELVVRFARVNGVRVISLANVGNHLHLYIKLGNRFAYTKFIRALTGAIAMAVSGHSRWKKAAKRLKFWDYRPFSRVVIGKHSYLALSDYIKINQLEGLGRPRAVARFEVGWAKAVQADRFEAMNC